MELKDVENLAELAKIELSQAEKDSLIRDFDSILAYVKQVEEVEVEDVKTENPVYNIWREDEERVREYSKELIAKQFPESQDGFLKVKKIL